MLDLECLAKTSMCNDVQARWSFFLSPPHTHTRDIGGHIALFLSYRTYFQKCCVSNTSLNTLDLSKTLQRIKQHWVLNVDVKVRGGGGLDIHVLFLSELLYPVLFAKLRGLWCLMDNSSSLSYSTRLKSWHISSKINWDIWQWLPT